MLVIHILLASITVIGTSSLQGRTQLPDEFVVLSVAR